MQRIKFLSTSNQLITNEKGAVTILLLLFVILCINIYVLFVSKMKKDFSHLNQITNLYLCHKGLNTQQAIIIKQIEKTNKRIRAINVLILASMAKPIFMKALKKLKKIIQQQQNFYRFSFIKNIISYQKKGCRYFPPIVSSPYKKKRSFSGELVLRRRKWSNKTLTKAGNLTVKNSFVQGRYRQKTKAGLVLHKLLFSFL